MADAIKLDNMNRVSVAGLKEAVADAAALGLALFVHGSFGLGKTQVVGQALKEMGYEPVDWFRASSMTPDALAGIPYIDGDAGERRVLMRAVPEIIRACQSVADTGKRPALVLDELNIATPMMLGAMLQLILERRLGEFRLPEGTPVVAMGNMETDGSIVSMLPKPAANRFGHVYYTGPTFEEFETYAVGRGLHPAVMQTIRSNPRLLCEYESVREEGGDLSRTRWATPRSWEMASRHLHLLTQRGVTSDAELAAVASRYVGDAAATALRLALAESVELAETSDILASPETAPLPPEDNAPRCYMQLLKLAQGLAEKRDLAQRHVDAALRYVKRFEPAWMPVFLVMGRGQPAVYVLLLSSPELADIDEAAVAVLSRAIVNNM